MSVSYTCPNPDCGVTLKTPNRVPAGKSVKCPKCTRPFVPEPADGPAGPGGTFKLADDEPTPKGGPAKPDPAEKPPEPAAKKSPFIDDDDEDAESVRKGYGVIGETEEEKEQAEKNKPKFTEVQDKFKKSARGPALALLVMPSNLLTFEGLVTVAGGIGVFVIGMWPLVFNDAPPGEEELEEAVATMLIGMFTMLWGGLVCFGASQMQELGSYTWAMAGSVIGILPILVGIFGIVMLQNPKVKAGFEEMEGIINEDEDDDDDDDGDDDDDDDDDDGDEEGEDEEDEDDDEDEGRAKKPAKKAGRKLLKEMSGGDDE